MLKKITLLCFVIGAINVNAQFTIDVDTLHIRGYAKVQESDFVDLFEEAHITSTNPNGEVIKWQRTVNTLPDQGWSTAVCDVISCKPPEVDTGSFYFGAGSTGLLSLHCYPSAVRGNGEMIVRFYRADEPLEFHDIVVMMEVWKPTGLMELYNSSSQLFPNPTNNVLTIVNNEIKSGQLEILNAVGQVIAVTEFESGKSIDLSNLSTGIYTAVISNGVARSATQFSKY